MAMGAHPLFAHTGESPSLAEIVKRDKIALAQVLAWAWVVAKVVARGWGCCQISCRVRSGSRLPWQFG